MASVRFVQLLQTSAGAQYAVLRRFGEGSFLDDVKLGSNSASLLEDEESGRLRRLAAADESVRLGAGRSSSELLL